MVTIFIALSFGYLAGSIPSGVIISRLGGVPDPRGIGSGNIGATNVLRSGRKDLAALTLLADALKGTFAVLIAAHFDDGHAPVPLAVAAACGAFLGHLFPVFLGFRGGKGVATFLGCLLGLAWPAALAFAAVWLITACLTRYSSGAALVASAATPVVLAALRRPDAAVLFAALAALLWWKHSANIGRLLSGTESKIGQKSGSAA
jgi:acyl phosphate:glycerol-3-phosphate acyltransferase